MGEKVFWVWGQHEPMLPARPVAVVARSLEDALRQYVESAEFEGQRAFRVLDPVTGEGFVRTVRAERVVTVEVPNA